MRNGTSRRGARGLKGIVGVLGAAAVIVLGMASPAAADPPTTDQFEFVFPDVNPCTGDIHTVTIVLTESQHFHGDNFIGSGKTTITTEPTEFSGRGTTTLVESKGVFVFRGVDILSDDAGNRISAKITFVEDPSTGAVRVERSELTCVHAAK